jgi:hypothetical protein
MEATTRATSRDRTNREQSRRMPPSAPFAKISATKPNFSRGQFPIHAPSGEKSHSPGLYQRQHRAGFAIKSAEQNPNSP